MVAEREGEDEDGDKDEDGRTAMPMDAEPELGEGRTCRRSGETVTDDTIATMVFALKPNPGSVQLAR